MSIQWKGVMPATLTQFNEDLSIDHGLMAEHGKWLIIAAYAQAWGMFVALLGVMILVFGSIPFTDAMIVRYVDDRLRSRVAGMRLTVAFGISSLAVWVLGPLVKGIGFQALLWAMAGIAALKAAIVLLLPDESSH